MANRSVTCPFCGSTKGTEYFIQLHIEQYHTDDSPFLADAVSSSSISRTASRPSSGETDMGDMWTGCPRPGCGEQVHLSGIDEHLDMHTAESLQEVENSLMVPPLPPRGSSEQVSKSIGHALSVKSAPEIRGNKTFTHEASTRSSPAHFERRRDLQQNADKASRSSSSNLSYLSGSSSSNNSSPWTKHKHPRNPGRLGKKELGPHAFEKEMPSEVRRDLIHAAEPQQVNRIGQNGKLHKASVIKNQTAGIIPVLADLAALDRDNVATYLCHPSTKHIHKLECDGNFCGYWNIQVLLTYVQHINPSGPQKLPHVLQIQDVIEQAWKNGICAYGKIETGGILNTRKWIGTNEALAFFTQIGIKADAQSFDNHHSASEDLLDYIEAYFTSGADSAKKQATWHITQLAPVYFQRPGHSMTIVGIERKRDGSRNLLIFDSSFKTSNPMRRLAEGNRAQVSPHALLSAYRRTDMSLSKWKEFEILIPQPQANR